MAKRKKEPDFSDIEEKEDSDLGANEAEVSEEIAPKKSVAKQPEENLPGKYRKFKN